MFRALAKKSLSYVRKIVILVVGSTVVIVGVIMIFTPGPAIVVIPAGLAILAIEFAWARNLLHRSRDYIARQAAKAKSETSGSSDRPPGQLSL
jgi:uncharacterized protein (TIGR02611 family)